MDGEEPVLAPVRVAPIGSDDPSIPGTATWAANAATSPPGWSEIRRIHPIHLRSQFFIPEL
jgi:hypothetical protein